jgi:hypothetical protein
MHDQMHAKICQIQDQMHQMQIRYGSDTSESMMPSDAGQIPFRCPPDAHQMHDQMRSDAIRCMIRYGLDITQIAQMHIRCTSDAHQMHIRCTSDAHQMRIRCASDARQMLHHGTRLFHQIWSDAQIQPPRGRTRRTILRTSRATIAPTQVPTSLLM